MLSDYKKHLLILLLQTRIKPRHVEVRCVCLEIIDYEEQTWSETISLSNASLTDLFLNTA
jgi:hypothetical protein